ncbi:unnamed protein product [Acanthoscelides obtectus]|uniref:DUF7869 domain-containing protein n=1 Tax=Acanthoscelides obtectus TaxID=200917 RepID=A0A9P0PKC1_ACAOB|nr:unnamed protein product [Acanthoscelides obtectus]CAK1646297.1 hypothetical protein AOBTE_LOCUS14564 [Acanthoscelides obtectus]
MSNRARLLVELARNSASSAVASHQVPKDDNINNFATQLNDASDPQRTESMVQVSVQDLLGNAELVDNPILTVLEEIPKETSHSKTDEKLYYLEQNTDSDSGIVPIIDYQEEVVADEEEVHDATSDTERHSEPDPFQESGSEYLPTDTDSENSLGNENVENQGGGNQEDRRTPDGRTKKRKSKGQRDPSQWKRAKNSQARLKGHAYMGFQKNTGGKYQQTVCRVQRKVKPSCGGHKNDSKGPQQKFECLQITNEMRNQIFQSFWEISSWEDNPESTKKYHVCKKMFLATLGIGERCVREWVLNKCLPNMELGIEPALVEPPQDSECTKNVNQFLDSLPKVESHYCRASTRKLYLEPTWNSYRHLHREFINYCERQNLRPCSWRLFYKTFKTRNLEIYTPRKDQCNTCVNLSQADYDSHVAKKEQARSEKEQDKQEAISSEAGNSKYVYTMDLQAVLLCPFTQASAMYYKQKLKVHNQTFFNLNNKDVSCYLWHEGNGGLDSDVFVSILVKFLNEEIERQSPKVIILWSDGCTYQNRNVNLSNGLLEIAMEKNIIIEQKYLEVGHTQMEVDSVHSVIERKLGRRNDIAVPADYNKIIRAARQNPSPYKVVSLHFNDFLQYKKGMYSQIRPGSKKGDPCVTDICALQYLPEGLIKYKINFSDEWLELPRRPCRTRTSFSHEPLYLSPRQIEDTKFIHLQELKSVIESDYHGFYVNLKHSCKSDQVCSHIKN